MIGIYLDQNVFGHLLDYGDWKTHPIGQVLHRFSGQVGVWVSPTHVIELSQTTNHSRRAALARLMLELCDAKRMWAGTDFQLIQMFGAFLNGHIPDTFTPAPYFSYYEENTVRLWLGYLGLLAAVEDLKLGPGKETIRRMKRETILLNSRIASNPKVVTQGVLDAARKISTSTNLDPLGLTKISDTELEAEITDCRQKASEVPQADLKWALKTLGKNRKEISSVYGMLDVGSALKGIFNLPCDLDLTFNAELLVKGWPIMQSFYRVGALPSSVTSVPIEQLRGNHDVLITILNHAIEAAAHANLTAASIGYYTLLRELEQCLNNGSLPTDGAALDVDHAMAALYFPIFVSQDKKLQANVATFLSSNNLDRHSVQNAAQLEKAIKKLKG